MQRSKLWAYVLALGISFTCVSSLANAGTMKSSDRNVRDRSERSAPRSLQKQARRDDYLNYLPFGTGQFDQGKTYLGIGLAAAEAGSLFMYFDRLQQIKAANADATAVYQSADPIRDKGLYEFYSQNEAFVKDAQKQSQFALISFLGLYAVGVIDALFDPFHLLDKAPKKKMKNKRKSDDDDFAIDDSTGNKEEVDQVWKETEQRSIIGLYVAPESNTYTYGLSLTFKN